MTTTPTASPTMTTTSLHRLLQGFHVPLSVLAPPPAQPTYPHQRGSLASSPTVDPALLLRLDFLWQQALAHLPTNPTYSRTLSRRLIRTRDVALAHAALHPRFPELLCVDCGVILVPGLTARARLHPRRKSCPINAIRRHRRHNKKHEHASSGGVGSVVPPPMLKNEVTYACLLCQGVNKADGVSRRTGGAATAKEANAEIKAQSSFIVPPPPLPPQQQRERQPPAAPAEEEEFIPLHPQGKKRPYQHQGQPQAPRLLLDAKPRKRKAQEEKKKQQQRQPKPESRSLGQLRGFLSSLKKP